MYVAFDSKEMPYYLAVCSMTDIESKIFIINDPSTGLETLKKAELEYVVTGGLVDSCVLLALKSTGAGF